MYASICLLTSHGSAPWSLKSWNLSRPGHTSRKAVGAGERERGGVATVEAETA